MNKRVILAGGGLLLLLMACHPVRKSVIQEPDPRWLNLVAEGDRLAEKRHYLGWLGAEQQYAAAAKRRETPELVERRARNLGLLLLRRAALQVSWGDDYERFQQLRPAPQSAIERCLDWLLSFYRIGARANMAVEKDAAINRQAWIEKEVNGKFAEPVIEVDAWADDREIWIYHKYAQQRMRSLESLRALEGHLRQIMSTNFPDSPLNLFIKRDEVGSFTRFIDMDEDYLEPRLFEAQQLQSQGRRSSAEKWFLYVMGSCDHIPGVWRGLGMINLAWENHEKAMAYFRQVLTWHKNDYETLFGMGAAQFYSKRYEDSLATFSILVERNLPYQGEARYYKGLNLFHLKRFDESLEQLQSAKEYIADLPDLWELEGMIHYQFARLEQAKACFTVAHDLIMKRHAYPMVSEFYLGLIAYRNRHRTEAWGRFERATWLDMAEVERLISDLADQKEGADAQHEGVVKRRQIRRSLLEMRERLRIMTPLLKGCPTRIRKQMKLREGDLVRFEGAWGEKKELDGQTGQTGQTGRTSRTVQLVRS